MPLDLDLPVLWTFAIAAATALVVAAGLGALWVS
jgi:hypothetical protein